MLQDAVQDHYAALRELPTLHLWHAHNDNGERHRGDGNLQQLHQIPRYLPLLTR